MFTRYLLSLCCLLLASCPVFAQNSSTDLWIGDSRIELQIRGQGSVSPEQLEGWVSENAQAVSEYFHQFPVENLFLRVEFVSGDHLRGRTYGFSKPAIHLRIGDQVSTKQMAEHWILSHEMSHLAFPNAEGHRWLEEGMATYLEPILRVRAGLLDEDKFWKDMLWGLPKGLPKRGHRGLAYDTTWGRTYWGGALFWFLVDLDVRLKTQNKKSVDDIFRAILAEGGNIRSVWSPREIARVGDAATGTRVMSERLESFALNPGTVDLSTIWQNLGVKKIGGRVVFNPAPWSPLRNSLTRTK